MVQYRYSYYEKPDGTVPVEEFVDKLSATEQANFLYKMEKFVMVYGPLTPHNILHKVGEFYQITIGKYRYLSVLQGQQFILLHAFRKVSQKTKPADITRAEGYLEELQGRTANVDKTKAESKEQLEADSQKSQGRRAKHGKNKR